MAQSPPVTLIGQDGLTIASASNPLPTALDTASINVTAIISGTITTKEVRSGVGTLSAVAASTSDGTILAGNVNRLGYSVYNSSVAVLFLLAANATSSSSNFTLQMPPNGYFEGPFNYTGVLKGSWSSANGTAMVTEYT